MARAFRCKSCGTGYSTTGDDVPPSPNWDDGHVCEMVEVESKLNVKVEQDPFMLSQITEEERDARMKNIGQNGNTGEHYGGE